MAFFIWVPSTDRSGKPAQRWLGQLFVEWFSNEFDAELQWYSVTANSSTSSRIRSRRNARRDISSVFTTGSSVMRSSARTKLNWVAERYVVKWTNWRTRTTYHITTDEIQVYRNNWWIRFDIVGSDTMPERHPADFKQALTTLRTAQERMILIWCRIEV